MDIEDTLRILTDAAKYDAACTSSGAVRKQGDFTSSNTIRGCCHSYAADGRCITLLKVLLTNVCIYDCRYCVNRSSNDIPRASFTPSQLADLTIAFYRRNYIEGLFLSSAVLVSPDYTTERMIQVLSILRDNYGFTGYIHAKAIPGTAPELLHRLGELADRLSVNIELPSSESLARLAPDKQKQDILTPMLQLRNAIVNAREDGKRFRHAPSFSPAGQATQMIIGATEETDYQIMRLAEGLYQRYHLKRVFYSAYIPILESSLLPSPQTFQPPLLREHRLYQADWLLRYYHFQTEELLSEDCPSLNPHIDPKCNWALNHLEFFPVEVNHADYHTLLRVPGIGITGARRIMEARRWRSLDDDSLKKLGIVFKRAQYFITCSHRMTEGLRLRPEALMQQLTALERPTLLHIPSEQLSLFES